MSRLLSGRTTKIPGIISLALLLLGGLGFWAAGGPVSGSGEKSGVFAEGVHVAFAPSGEQPGVLKRASERQLVGDDNGSPFWLVGRAPDLIPAFLSELFPAGAAHEFYSGTLRYPSQVPRAPPLA